MATGTPVNQPTGRLNLVRDFKVCTLNVCTMNELGVAVLLDKELSRMGLTGLQEVRWPGIGEVREGNTKFLWSGSARGSKKNGVALAMLPHTLLRCCRRIQ